jgi:FMN-dependent NADH-azoreductase
VSLRRSNFARGFDFRLMIVAFIGIANPEFISADGIQIGPEYREKALASALQAATYLHAA